jgi:glycerophosphoryl diester phosphodiesterase
VLVFFNIAAFFIIAVLATKQLKKNWLKWLLCVCFSVVLTAQIVSVVAGGTLVDYRFFLHANANDALTLHQLFGNGLLYIAIAILLNTILIYYAGHLAKKITLLKNKYVAVAILIVSIGLMCFNNGILYNAFKAFSIRHATVHPFNESIEKLGLHNYVESQNITAKAGKNILVISIESFEKAYLHPSFEHLTPFLSSLKNEWHFQPIIPFEGSNWTSGSLYTYLTGFPAFFSGDGNSIFQQSESTRITSLSHILKAANYTTSYLCGNTGFAGTEDLLKTMAFDSIIDYRNLITKYQTEPSYGLHDLDLFAESKQRLLQLKQQTKPFALFLSTISTHHPNGIYDQRMNDKVKHSGSELEFMVAAVDYMLKDLIGFLKTEGLLENTAVFIFPDHLKMGSGAAFKHTGKRELFLLSNTAFMKENSNKQVNLFQIDLPRLILNGAGINSNAVFLCDRIPANKADFLYEKQKEIASLNSAGLMRKNIWNADLDIEKISENKIEVQFARTIISVSSDSLLNRDYVLCFSPELRFKQSAYISKGHFPSTGGKDLQIKIELKNNFIHASLMKEGYLPLQKKHTKKINYVVSETSSMVVQHPAQSLQLIWKTGIPQTITGNKNKTYSEETVDINEPIPPCVVKITYSCTQGAKPFLIMYNKPFAPNRIFIHEALPDAPAIRTFTIALQQTMDTPCLILRNWSDTGNFYVKSVYINEQPKPKKSKLKPLYLKDVQRFIAHAGGSINGHVYTNCKEALDENYKKGFRLFELDILETSDGKFVAAHDWEYWKKISAYSGPVPVNEELFKAQKILGKYTAIGLKEINQWFYEHPDAILVTDKVSKPKEFSEVFIDKKRLMMEVFSMNAFQQAKKAGIKAAFISENILNEMQGNIASQLEKMGATHVALSRQSIEFRKDLLNQLKEKNIKVYVFHVNFDVGKDEEYVLDYELDFVYGMYADYWPVNP